MGLKISRCFGKQAKATSEKKPNKCEPASIFSDDEYFTYEVDEDDCIVVYLGDGGVKKMPMKYFVEFIEFAGRSKHQQARIQRAKSSSLNPLDMCLTMSVKVVYGKKAEPDSAKKIIEPALM